MGKKDPRVDAYIAKAPPFATPILRRLRQLVHRGCPNAVEEIKWGVPHFNYGGMFCGMAAFKAHCALVFWNRALNIPKNEEAMGQFGRITTLSDLPSDRVIVGLVRQAKELADSGIKAGPVRRPQKALPVPPALLAALKKKAGALTKFKAFSPSKQREYSEWIGEAKTDATRDKRIGISAGWIAEGKPRHWKYHKTKKA
jgi:uncharacterized protein YdeI (YjbR/CyaY-like superfamily)